MNYRIETKIPNSAGENVNVTGRFGNDGIMVVILVVVTILIVAQSCLYSKSKIEIALTPMYSYIVVVSTVLYRREKFSNLTTYNRLWLVGWFFFLYYTCIIHPPNCLSCCEGDFCDIVFSFEVIHFSWHTIGQPRISWYLHINREFATVCSMTDGVLFMSRQCN